MLVKFFIKCYRGIVETFCWILLVAAFVGGWIYGANLLDSAGKGFLMGLLYLLSAFIFECILIPSMMILFDTNENVSAIRAMMEKNQKNPSPVSYKAPINTSPISGTEGKECCPQCHAVIEEEGSKFCGVCGFKFEEKSE